MKPKKPGIVEELKEKHKARLARAQQELKKQMARPGKRFDHYYYTSDMLLFYKWAYRVGKGWYGFALGNLPRVWTDVLDEFLCWLEIQRPDFEIHQIKMKLGFVRIYLGTKTHFVIPDQKIRSEISQLQNLLRLHHARPHASARLAKNVKNIPGQNEIGRARLPWRAIALGDGGCRAVTDFFGRIQGSTESHPTVKDFSDKDWGHSVPLISN